MKSILIYSGGLDSTTLLHHLLDEGQEVECLSFDYGQKHVKELEYAKYWTELKGLPHNVIQFPRGMFSASALTGDVAMPRGHYSDESMRTTVVANRNMVMLAVAASIAIQRGIDAVAYAAHAGDRDTYPDCRPEFVEAMKDILSLCHYDPVTLYTPFLHLSKREVAQRAQELGFDIERTWSCYEGGERPCGSCGACSSRQEALA